MDVTVYAISQSWTEGVSFNHSAATSGSDWLNRTNTETWNTPGGDFNTSYNFGNGNNGIVTQSTGTPNNSIRFGVTHPLPHPFDRLVDHSIRRPGRC